MNSKLYTRFYSNEGVCNTFGSKTFAVKTDEGYTIHTEIPTTEAKMCHKVVSRLILRESEK